jgi:drug/metabolite transporter (DMT)-like permease
MGAMGTAGQLLLTRGYGVAPAAQVSPFTYFSVVFGAVYGYLFWGETLDWLFVAGASLIAFAGVMAVRGLGTKQVPTVMRADVETT